MIGTPQTRGLYSEPIRAALTAGARGAIRNDAPHRDAERDAVVAQLNGPNTDDVEHVRQSRLKRWQEAQ